MPACGTVIVIEQLRQFVLICVCISDCCETVRGTLHSLAAAGNSTTRDVQRADDADLVDDHVTSSGNRKAWSVDEE